MQNRYVGDVGDFGKYGLLRTLTVDCSLGVVWYLTLDEGNNADGKHVSYLVPSATNRARYRNCDPDLYDRLGKIVHDKARSVKSVRQRGILRTGTGFYDKVLTYDGMPSIGLGAKNARLKYRRHWVEQALHATQHCDIVFLDPDNGFESGTKRHGGIVSSSRLPQFWEHPPVGREGAAASLARIARPARHSWWHQSG